MPTNTSFVETRHVKRQHCKTEGEEESTTAENGCGILLDSG